MKRSVFDTVVYFLGGALLLSIAGVIVLNFFTRPVDDILKQVIVGCLTGIAGILAKDSGKAQDVNVVNQPTDPVPTEAQ